MRRRLLMVGAAGALALALPAAAKPRPPVHLGGPAVVKIDWNARSLLAVDLDGDGRTDMAVLNNDRARIDLLYQDDGTGRPARHRPSSGTSRWQPALEDAPFRRDSLTTGMTMYALAAGDLDGDGRTDLAFTTRRGSLVLRFQDRGGEWERSRVLEIENPAQWPSTLLAADADGDGDDDLLVLLERELRVYLQGNDGLIQPSRYPLSDDGCYGLLLEDLDHDGSDDLVYLAPRSSHGWRVRFQTQPGRFGPEHAFRLSSPAAGLRPLPDGADGRPRFATVNPVTGTIEILRLERRAPARELDAWQPVMRSFSATGDDGDSASYALGDLDGNGLTDVAVGDSRSSRVLVHLQNAPGVFGEPRSYPSFSGVSSLAAADLDRDGRDELLAVSAREQVLGVSILSRAGRLEYPSPLPFAGAPLAVAAADLDRDGLMDMVAARNRDGLRELAWLRRDTPDGEWVEQSIPLEGLGTDPEAIKILDADGDGRPDVAVFALQSPVRLVLQSAEGDLVDASADTAFQRGLVDKLRPAGLTASDMDQDGRPEMLAAHRGYARSLRLGGSGALQVLDQYNARDSDSDIASALPLDVDGDGTLEVLLLERGGQSLQMLSRDPDKVYRYARSLPVGRIDLVDALARDLDGDGATDLVYLGKDRFWWLPSRHAEWQPAVAASHEPEVEGMTYTTLATGDLDSDGIPEVIALDAETSHMMEVLDDNGDSMSSRLHFTVFDTDPHYSGRQGADREPRQILVADVTGDRRDDVILLVHDRILVYPQR